VAIVGTTVSQDPSPLTTTTSTASTLNDTPTTTQIPSSSSSDINKPSSTQIHTSTSSSLDIKNPSSSEDSDERRDSLTNDISHLQKSVQVMQRSLGSLNHLAKSGYGGGEEGAVVGDGGAIGKVESSGHSFENLSTTKRVVAIEALMDTLKYVHLTSLPVSLRIPSVTESKFIYRNTLVLHQELMDVLVSAKVDEGVLGKAKECVDGVKESVRFVGDVQDYLVGVTTKK
jgi:hypothetical protein